MTCIDGGKSRKNLSHERAFPVRINLSPTC